MLKYVWVYRHTYVICEYVYKILVTEDTGPFSSSKVTFVLDEMFRWCRNFIVKVLFHFSLKPPSPIWQWFPRSRWLSFIERFFTIRVDLLSIHLFLFIQKTLIRLFFWYHTLRFPFYVELYCFTKKKKIHSISSTNPHLTCFESSLKTTKYLYCRFLYIIIFIDYKRITERETCF